MIANLVPKLKRGASTLRLAALAGVFSLSLTCLCFAAVDLTKAGDLWAQSLTLEKNSDYKGALAKMTELNRNGADPYLVNLRTAWLCYENKDYDQSIANYQAAAGRSPGSLTPLLGLINAYRAKSDNDNAERVCRQILARDNGNATALQTLGAIYFEAKDYQNASTTYATLLKLYPEDTTALSGYGWAKIYLGQKADAIASFQRLLIVSPTYDYAQQGYNTATTP